MTNRFFDNESTKCEQDLIESLTDEVIDIHGNTFYYLPRKLSDSFNINIFNEDRLSTFPQVFTFTGYLENPTEGMSGNGYMLEKFGGLVDFSITITISHLEWMRSSRNSRDKNNNYRPAEGDLIYYPTTSTLYEIKFVDDKAMPFAQLGRTYSYRLTCETMQYGSENIDTGLLDVDSFEKIHSENKDSESTWNGGIISVNIVDGGLGYSRAPRITVLSPTGKGAKLKASLGENGEISSIKIINQGSGYRASDTSLKVGGKSTKSAILKANVETLVEKGAENFGANIIFQENAKALDALFETISDIEETESDNAIDNNATNSDALVEFNPDKPFG